MFGCCDGIVEWCVYDNDFMGGGFWNVDIVDFDIGLVDYF